MARGGAKNPPRNRSASFGPGAGSGLNLVTTRAKLHGHVDRLGQRYAVRADLCGIIDASYRGARTFGIPRIVKATGAGRSIAIEVVPWSAEAAPAKGDYPARPVVLKPRGKLWNTTEVIANKVVAARFGVGDFRLRPTRTGFIQVSLNKS